MQLAPGNSMYPDGGPGRFLKSRLRQGPVLLGGIMTEYARPSLVKLYKLAGFDFLYIENEHTFFERSAMADAVQCARDVGLPVIAKTPQLERGEVARLLDCGVVGIQLPRTETREQVETLRSYLKFHPGGTRAVAPGMGNSDYRPTSDWQQWMNDQDAETLLVVHLETGLGYENAEEIIATPGVDMVYVGPGDFSIAMGHPGRYEHPAVLGAMENILGHCVRHNVPFGTTAANGAAAKRWMEKGARFFETVDELSLIYEGAKALVDSYRPLDTTSG